MAELLECLSGARQPPGEPVQRGDGSRERPPERDRELLRGARRVNACQERLDEPVVDGGVALQPARVAHRRATG
jgi:hypothetical protein